MTDTLPWALPLLVLLSLGAWRLGAVTPSGAVTGTLLGAIVAFAPSVAPFWTFILFVLVGSTSSKIGSRRKKELGVMQENEGRRDWSHAFFNCAPAAGFVLLGIAPFAPTPATAELLAATALAAMLADTSASEWGTLLGGTPRHILTFRPAPVGTDGAVSLVGMSAGTLAACLGAIPILVWSASGFRGAVVVAIAGASGNVLDSIFGATIQVRLGRHGGACVNMLASASAAGVAVLILAAW